MNDAGSLRQFGDCTGNVPAGLRLALARAALGLLCAAAVAIVSRRAAGALVRPLDSATLLVCMALVVVAAAAIRVAWLDARRNPAIMFPLSLAVAGMAFGLCLPGTHMSCLFAVALLVLLEESWAWISFLRHLADVGIGRLGATAGLSGSASVSREVYTAGQAGSGTQAETMLIAPPAAEVVEQMSRRRAADGAEEIAGWLRVSFAAGQRTAAAHAAFCPPLAAVPDLTFSQLDGPAARIKPGQVLPFGIRLDLKLSAAAEAPADVLLQFTARAKAE